MSQELPSRVKQPRFRHARVVIVAAQYNEKYTDALLENCRQELEEAAGHIEVEVLRVPGAFEVPMMVRRVLAGPGAAAPDAVVALGVILRGSTAHADLIGTAVTQQLMAISCETLTPVIHEVLLLDNEQQAYARCVAAELNRGCEAARCALRMLDAVEEQGIMSRRAARSARL